ncbi:MAG: NADH-quinone oxidoreductase subunit NuoH [Armatimonadetes bacterium]|nr:NADH-quinone oxidoreductase subunit NuoH [Armatimonadota bacterium]
MDQYLAKLILKFFHYKAPFLLLALGTAIITVAFVSLTVLFLIWLERKISAKIQSRMGPMLNGPRFMAQISMWLGGIFQTLWDALKLLLKEQVTPQNADKIVFWSAPVVVFTACLMTYVVIPFGPGLVVKDLNLGLLYILAVSTFSVISILMAGWGSNNKYSLLGGFRSAAQIISYEVPLIFSLLGVMILAGSLKLSEIVLAQGKVWFIIPQFLGFLIYFICSIAELNRPPFDIPEAESELVAGFHTEYSGMGFAMFFLSEFANMFVISALITTLFLGGWLLPFGLKLPSNLSFLGITIPYFNLFGSVLIFLIKTYLVILFFMWVRWTYPRPRPDQLMTFSWKILLPLSFLNLIGTSLGVIIWKI